jgi:hypothetical protein
MKRFFTAFSILIASAWFLFGTSPAACDEVSWYTIDGGGTMFSTGGTYSLGGTIGQPDAQIAPVMTGGTFDLTGGFWPIANVCYCPGDMNSDGRRDGRDIQQFVNCVLAGGNCSCADVDLTGGVTLADVSAFVNTLLSGGVCP